MDLTVIVRCYCGLMKNRKKSKTAMLANHNKSPSGDLAREIAQAGAICYRRTDDGRLEVLMVGSRRNGRWGVPKGHLGAGESSDLTASRESFEEAGVIGSVDRAVFGSFTYRKDSTPHRYHVAVHLLEVTGISDDYPEKTIRKKAWFPLDAAVTEASQPGLRALMVKLANSRSVPSF
ncbi:NUDIX hydrolase [Rhizobium croatiense]|nr:NUDIX hydrolase [Rhizobium croatiense]